MVSHALKAAEKGFAVFPVAPGKRRPLIKMWQLRATTDAHKIKAYWGRWPTANVGLACQKRIIVFDIDKKTEGHKESLSRLVALGLKPDYAVSSPSGGLHVYYQHPGGHVKSVVGSSWGYPGIDLRGNGGYVLAAGSIADGKRYSLASSGGIPVLPLALQKALPIICATVTDAAAEGIKLSASDLPDIIRCGERNDTMYRYICYLVSKTNNKAEVTSAAKKAFERCEQASGDDFTWATVESMITRALDSYGDKEAPVDSLSRALCKYLYIESGSMVADLEASHDCALLKVGEWAMSKGNVFINAPGGRKKLKPLPAVWLAHPKRSTVYRTAYWPNKPKVFFLENVPVYNEYVPPKIRRSSGDKYKTVLRHIEYLFSESDEEPDTLIQWLAHVVRYPDKKIPWVPLIISDYYGIGKSWWFQLGQKLFGPSNCYRIDPEALQPGAKTEWKSGTFVVLDEILPRKDFARKMQPIISETFGIVEHKYGKKEHRQLFFNMMAFSNHADAINIDENDRRWWVVHTKCRPQPPEYYVRLFSWLDTSGPGDFLELLHRIDLTGFQYAAPPPGTSAKEQMVDHSRSPVERLIRDAIDSYEGPFKYDLMTSGLALEYAMNRIQMNSVDLQTAQRSLRLLLPRLAVTSLKNNRVTLKAGKRVRLAALRNPDVWRSASRKALLAEYAKAEKALYDNS